MIETKHIMAMVEQYVKERVDEALSGMKPPMSLIERIREKAAKFGLDPAIVYGVCKKESGLDPNASRYESEYRWVYEPSVVKPRICSLDTERTLQKMSHGLMQVMGGVFRELGYKGWLTAVYADIDLQLEYGCRHLSNKIKKYGLNAGIAAYNSGSPSYLTDGSFKNQSYVDNVLAFAKEYPGA